MIKDLVERAVVNVSSIIGKELVKTLPATPLGPGIPTLRIGEYRPFTPQLKERYELFGRWEMATHGHWLGLSDMESLWKTPIENDFLDEIQSHRLAGETERPNEASSLFKPERLSLFAGSDINYEKIYLLWLDCEDEPELWVYDPNGESRYKDLEEYLNAFLAGDISACERRWHR